MRVRDPIVLINNMATLASVSSAQSSTGYGPSAHAAGHAVPIFNGNRKSFEDFDFKLTAIAIDLNLDAILLHPEVWTEKMDSARSRIESRSGGQMSTRSGSQSASVEDPAIAADRAFLVAEEIKSRKLAALIIGKLSDGVAAPLRASLIHDEWFDAIAVYRFLKLTYSTSDEAKKVVENPETVVLQLLSRRWEQGTFFVYVQQAQQKLNSVLLSRKMANDTAQRVLTGLVLKHLLDQAREKYHSNLEPLLVEFMPRVLAGNLLADNTMRDFVLEAERISLLHPMSEKSHHRGPAGQPKSESHRGSGGGSGQRSGGGSSRGGGGSDQRGGGRGGGGNRGGGRALGAVVALVVVLHLLQRLLRLLRSWMRKILPQ